MAGSPEEQLPALTFQMAQVVSEHQRIMTANTTLTAQVVNFGPFVTEPATGVRKVARVKTNQSPSPPPKFKNLEWRVPEWFGGLSTSLTSEVIGVPKFASRFVQCASSVRQFSQSRQRARI